MEEIGGNSLNNFPAFNFLMALEWKRKITSAKSKVAISSKSPVTRASAVSKVRELAELHAGNYARKNLSPPRFTYGTRGGVHTFYPSTPYHRVVSDKAIDLIYRLSDGCILAICGDNWT